MNILKLNQLVDADYAAGITMNDDNFCSDASIAEDDALTRISHSCNKMFVFKEAQ